VLDQTGQLAHLVEDLRTLALSDAGELTLDKHKLEITALIRKVIDSFQPVANGRNQHIEFGAGFSGKRFVYADPMRMDQVLNNLIGNALRHTPEAGIVNLCLEEQSNKLLIRIMDSGTGIPEEALPYIFERFYRADQSRSRQDGGSGLGLAIARRIVELHKGTLTAANMPQGGAVFDLTLPKA
jgi:signal transduction histidine kinase